MIMNSKLCFLALVKQLADCENKMFALDHSFSYLREEQKYNIIIKNPTYYSIWWNWAAGSNLTRGQWNIVYAYLHPAKYIINKEPGAKTSTYLLPASLMLPQTAPWTCNYLPNYNKTAFFILLYPQLSNQALFNDVWQSVWFASPYGSLIGRQALDTTPRGKTLLLNCFSRFPLFFFFLHILSTYPKRHTCVFVGVIN